MAWSSPCSSLHETGMVKASPTKLLAQGTDWHFLTELQKELET